MRTRAWVLTAFLFLATGAPAAVRALADEIKESDPWFADFDKAVEKAKAENKPLLVDFNGSDW